MRKRAVILHRPAPAQSVEGFLNVLLQILSILEALYNVFVNLFSNVR